MGRNFSIRKYKSHIIIVTVTVVVFFVILILSKKLNINQFPARKYTVHGIDVSHHQNKINWNRLKDQKIDFAFIKATEGSNYKDQNFKQNWQGAQSAGILTGAYHFFSFDSPASSQADNFINTTGALYGSLVPVADVEFYADKEKNPPGKESVVAQLKEFLELLEKEYGRKPIIYTTYKVYKKYIKGSFNKYPLWIRNVYYPPSDIKNGWQFWQYSDTGSLQGVKGDVDLDVFYGTKKELEELIIPEHIQ